MDPSAVTTEHGLDAVDALEVERLRRILAAKVPYSPLLELPLPVLLERLGIIASSSDLRLTLAGLLIVGREELLHRTVPGHEVVYLHMRGETEYDRRLDSRKPLLALLEQLSQAVEPHNRLFTLKLGLFHFEIPDFPEEVCREAFLNAFTHRDYSQLAPVYIRHYIDRIEVSSPGGFHGGVTPQNIIGHEPVSRNPLLASILQKIRLVERAGIGVKRMYHILLSYGKEPPLYEADSERVRLTIRSGRSGSCADIDEVFAKFVAEEQHAGRELALSDLLVLNWLTRNREIDIVTAQRLLQRSEEQSREILEQMTARSLLEPFGQKKGRIYRLSKTVYARLRKTVGYSPIRRAEAAYAEAAIMAYLEELSGPPESRFITNEIVRTILRVSPDQATYLLGSLRRKGRLVLRGRTRGARYYPTRQLSVF